MTLVDRLGSNLRPAPVTVELDDIQATVLRARPAPYYGTHVLLRIDDRPSGREFVRRLAPHVDSAADWWQAGEPWIAVAITYSGLAALGVSEDSLQEDGATFTIPQEPVRRRIHGVETFNVLRGGEYFFLPSLSALRWIGNLEMEEG
jgi:deferrochelatase/peroxidase EfeB